MAPATARGARAVQARAAGGVRGGGVFAVAAVRVGQCLLAEAPLVPRLAGESVDCAAARAAELPSTARAVFWALGDAGRERRGAVAAADLFRANALPCRAGAGGPAPPGALADAVFATLSRVGHACAPNAAAAWDGETMSLVAVRAIARGEEVCIAYVDVEEPGEPRRARLRARYGFDCACAACALPPAARAEDDRRRARAAELRGAAPRLAAGRAPLAALRCAEHRVELLLLAGIADAAAVAAASLDAYQLCLRAGRDAAHRRAAEAWLVAHAAHEELRLGADAPAARDAARLRRVPFDNELAKAAGWGGRGGCVR